MDTPETLHLVVTGISGDGHTASAELKRTHTGLTRVTRDNVAIFHCKTDAEAQEENDAAKSLNVGGILAFAEKARLEENGLRAEMSCFVSPLDGAAMQLVELCSQTDAPVRVALGSFIDVCIAPQEEFEAHPAFQRRYSPQ